MEYSPRARWIGWVSGSVLMGLSAMLVGSMMRSIGSVTSEWSESGWPLIAAIAFVIFFYLLTAAAAGYGMFAGFRIFREPSADSIRRVCLVAAVATHSVVTIELLGTESRLGREHILAGQGAGSVVGMILAGIVYWFGSRVLIRYAGVPEAMDDLRRERAAKIYMALLALMVLSAGTGITTSLLHQWEVPGPQLPLVLLGVVALAISVYVAGKTLLIALDRHLAQKDIPVATALPRCAADVPASMPPVPDYRAADDDIEQ